MLKVSFIFGTRPEAIKLAPLIQLCREQKYITTEVCSTGQHKEMLDQILDLFHIVPDVDLGLMTYNQSLPDFLSNSIKELNNYLIQSKPDLLFVQGDTSSVLAATLAGFYNKIKVFHVEAGLRTESIYSPFPEEMNRRLTSQIASMHFAPTERAKNNLIGNGINESSILVTGNTAIDALLTVKKGLESRQLSPSIDFHVLDVMDHYSTIVLITGHRRENFGEGFKQICNSIKALSIQHPHTLFLYPVHLNPNVKEVVYERLSSLKNVMLIPPQGYVEFIYLMMRAKIILTDSGGVQEEGPSLGKPILVMRDNTERPEGVEAGCSMLVGTDEEKIVGEVSRLLNDQNYYNSFNTNVNPYGDGRASKRILDTVLSFFGNKVDEQMDSVFK
jgi:UDP-N-acetylglucosamine 2-epimerase (non-hydrolysing)